MATSKRLAACLALAVLAVPGGAGLADPWKDESENGRGRGDRGGPPAAYAPPPPPRGYAEPRIPLGHLPPPGECRLWFPDRPAGHQPPPGHC